MDVREYEVWLREAARQHARQRLHQIEAVAFPHMDEWGASLLLDRIRVDADEDHETPEARYSAAREALRRRVEGR